MWKIDKNKTIDKFRDWMKKNSDYNQDRYDPDGAKEINYSEYQILSNIKTFYDFVLNSNKMSLRARYIHDDDTFLKIYNKLLSHIRNKIKYDPSKNEIYLTVNGNLRFDGNKEQYEKMILYSSVNRIKLIRNIIDELNKVLDGDVEEDHNKPVLNDLRVNEIQNSEVGIDEKSEVFNSIETSYPKDKQGGFEHRSRKFRKLDKVSTLVTNNFNDVGLKEVILNFKKQEKVFLEIVE